MKRFFRREEGDMILEAAMIVPIFMLFVFFLWTLIRISVMQMALDKATSEITQSAMLNAYGPSVVAGGVNTIEETMKKKATDGFDQYLNETIGSDSYGTAELTNFLTGHFKEISDKIDVTSFLSSEFMRLVYGEEGVLSKPKLGADYVSSMAVNDKRETKEYFASGKIKIDKVTAGDLFKGGAEYTLETSYELNLRLPFLKDKRIILYSISSGILWTTNQS